MPLGCTVRTTRKVATMVKARIFIALVAQSRLTLCDPVDCTPPGSSAHGISQARVLEWVAISFSRGSSQPRDQTQLSCSAGGFLTTEPPGNPQMYVYFTTRIF